ncbi:MAG: aldo/keto reductase [Pseudomonadota bacterium]
MKTKPLGRTGIDVTDYCLGTMTWGTQTPEADAHHQMDAALAAGITFVDTAEMYPVNPISAETIGLTETIIGNWHAKNPGRRGDYILATKHSGEGLGYVRDGAPISSKTIAETVEGSLARLQTDYIDLYQFHWPNRGSFQFRKNWDYDPTGIRGDDLRADVEDCLGALRREVEKGTIRAFGLSNESAWGTAQFLRVSEEKGLPRVASVQNEYSLLCRMYDTDMAEMSVAEDVGLLAFSPLACGFLTGKYQDGAVPPGSRMAIGPKMGGRMSPRVMEATKAYIDIAQAHAIDPTHMALAFCAQRPFIGSVIFGATTQMQLDHIIEGLDVTLSDDIMAAINEAHRAFPMPY